MDFNNSKTKINLENNVPSCTGARKAVSMGKITG